MIFRIAVDDIFDPNSKQVYVVRTSSEVGTEDILRATRLLSNNAICGRYAFVYEYDMYGPGAHGYRNIKSNKPYDLFEILEVAYSVEIGYLPGMTDNIGTSAAQIVENFLNIKDVLVHASKARFFKKLDHIPCDYNPLVQYCKLVHARADGKFEVRFLGNKSTDAINGSIPNPCVTPHPIPFIMGNSTANSKSGEDVSLVDLHVEDAELEKISRRGISGRGPLNLSLEAMHAIRAYFDSENRNPNDIELEALAQTWSEHCKHNIFSAKMDEIPDGLYKHYIKRATYEINSPICVSVFSDNAGAIVFDEDLLIVDKVETHNSPSALDPFGGAETGILGVNRDILGFGMGAKPIMNSYYFCFAESLKKKLYRDQECREEILSPQTIAEGVIKGVNSGGNCSGIPTALGSVYFDDRFCGKPLVFVGSTGIMPRKVSGLPAHVKTAQDGDYIVVIGGRVGRDGIHGATFSSHALREGIQATVVQVGSPITQKKLSDAIVKNARDLGLYNAITDNGAGGLSSSIGEMGSRGFKVQLDRVPLKTQDMLPWEIWISESQERMTLSVPPDKYPTLASIMQTHDVEISVIGEFNSTGRAVVTHNEKVVMDIDVDFLHHGMPKLALTTEKRSYTQQTKPGSGISVIEDLYNMMGRKNICSKEYIISQYDHEVQASSVIKPLQGAGRICGDAVVLRPVPSSQKGVVKSHGFGCRYGEADPYRMAACAIDTAIRNYAAVGGNVDHLALIDNFCWSNATDPGRLWQLKQAAKACYDYATAFGTPFISGKDSMFNDFHGYDNSGQSVHISAPPSLLISTLGIIENVENATSPHVKGNDQIYIIGTTYNELGMSEYQAYSGVDNDNIPSVDARAAKLLYRKFHHATTRNIISSAIAPGLGGLAVSLVKALIGGRLGAEIDLSAVPTSGIPKDAMWERAIMFSESQSRIVLTVHEAHSAEFESIFSEVPHALIGRVTQEYVLKIANVAEVHLQDLERNYKAFSNSHYSGRFTEDL
ncbi:phosphoribosylformylglycinamidine synthase subunit PurL [Anaplasma capra]|uniref:phosphoribosylformylglycinamidine synthase subunit PurL n=1 Tax=Anaplasma capra TaxID=1562740 RepID=UPI0021D5959D|nr:AIR synthase-related protein [Anaplasma capra]MCU7611820.1 AIR synthase-related protein [Anaplasma capra]MCU7612586.1 AIR synthase-related protein [Anaplasma capra]